MPYRRSKTRFTLAYVLEEPILIPKNNEYKVNSPSTFLPLFALIVANVYFYNPKE